MASVITVEKLIAWADDRAQNPFLRLDLGFSSLSVNKSCCSWSDLSKQQEASTEQKNNDFLTLPINARDAHQYVHKGQFSAH